VRYSVVGMVGVAAVVAIVGVVIALGVVRVVAYLKMMVRLLCRVAVFVCVRWSGSCRLRN